jgi:hypothetical protein
VSPESDPYRLIEHADHVEVASRVVGVSFAAADLELFGLLLAEKVNSIGAGHSERPVDSDRMLVSEAAEGWVAVLVVHGVEASRVTTVTTRVLAPPAADVTPSDAVGRLVNIVRSAAKEARDKPRRPYSWSSVIAPRGPDSALEPRARLALAGRYEWDGLVIEPLATAYEGSERAGWGVFHPYRERGIRAAGEIEASTGTLAQRAADLEVRHVCLLLSLFFRTAIEPRQQAASIVWGTPDDLTNLYGMPDVDDDEGIYSDAGEAFVQTAAEVPDVESDGKFRMPLDAPVLWRGIRVLDDASRTRLWNALGAYTTAWRLKEPHPSLSLVSLVTAIEAIVDPNELKRCPKCDSVEGLGKAYRRTIARYTGTAEETLKSFTDVMYGRRSSTLHSGVLFGGEDESMVGWGGSWAPRTALQFAWGEWPVLEKLTAAALMTRLREDVFAANSAKIKEITER